MAIAGCALLLAGCGSTAVPEPDCAEPQDPFTMIRYAPTVVLVDIVSTSEDGVAATAHLLEKWRGVTFTDQIEIRGDSDPDQPVRRFAEGTTYLVMSMDTFAPINDHGCSATRVFTDELAALRPDTAISYGAVRDAALWPWILAAGMVVAGIVVVGVVRRVGDRRRSAAVRWNPDHEIAVDEDGAGDGKSTQKEPKAASSATYGSGLDGR